MSVVKRASAAIKGARAFTRRFLLLRRLLWARIYEISPVVNEKRLALIAEEARAKVRPVVSSSRGTTISLSGS